MPLRTHTLDGVTVMISNQFEVIKEQKHGLNVGEYIEHIICQQVTKEVSNPRLKILKDFNAGRDWTTGKFLTLPENDVHPDLRVTYEEI